MRFMRVLMVLGVILGVIVGSGAISDAQSTLGRGAVVALRNTPHIWVADDVGVLHWAGDTRALATRYVDWGSRRDVELGDLRQLRRGDPWLSSGLLKMGDPIYLVKWETADPAPTLFHIQSLADVELFGINGDNYGSMVFEQPAWEGRFAMSAGGLARAALASATVVATPPPNIVLDAWRLNRSPRIGLDGDYRFVAPGTWTDSHSLEGYVLDTPDANTDPIYSSSVLGRWTYLTGTQPTYVMVIASNLDYNKDVKTVSDLARKSVTYWCKTAVTCSGADSTTAASFTGYPWQKAVSRARVVYSAKACTGCTDLVERVHEWIGYHYYTIRGNWGYEVRIFGESIDTFPARAQEVISVMEKSRFET